MKKLAHQCFVFFKNYLMEISLFISMILFFVSMFKTSYSFVTLAVLSVAFIFMPFEKILCIIVSYMFFSRTMMFYAVTVIGFFVIIVKYVIDLIKKNVRFYKWIFLATFSVCLFFIAIGIDKCQDIVGFVQGFVVIVLLFAVYLFFSYMDKINLRKVFMMMFVGLIISFVFTLLLNNSLTAKMFVYSEGEFSLKLINGSLIFEEPSGLKRLILFTPFPNILGAYCVFIMCYGVYATLNFSIKKPIYYAIYYVIFIVSFITGIMTLSKAFLIIAGMICTIGVALIIFKFKAKSIKYLFFVLDISLIIIIIFSSVFKDVFSRFHLYTGMFNETSVINTITTGRSAIWKAYLKKTFASFETIMFGYGIFAPDVQVGDVFMGAHSIYIGLFYRIGVFGVLLIIGLCFVYFFASGKKFRLNIMKMLPIVIFLIYSAEELNFDERFLFFIFGFMLLLDEKYDNMVVSFKKELNFSENENSVSENNIKNQTK